MKSVTEAKHDETLPQRETRGGPRKVTRRAKTHAGPRWQALGNTPSPQFVVVQRSYGTRARHIARVRHSTTVVPGRSPSAGMKICARRSASEGDTPSCREQEPVNSLLWVPRRAGRCCAPQWVARRRVCQTSRHPADLPPTSIWLSGTSCGEERRVMRVLHERCCGLDIHKKFVVACLLATGPDGSAQKEVRTYSTMTNELLALADWLRAEGGGPVVMESTGSYWRPVFNLLEGQCEVLVVNAYHAKAVPGRKTDVKDAEWLADLLPHGPLRARFIPPAPH